MVEHRSWGLLPSGHSPCQKPPCYVIIGPHAFPCPPAWGSPTCFSGLISYPSLHRSQPGSRLFLELATLVSVVGPLHML